MPIFKVANKVAQGGMQKQQKFPSLNQEVRTT